MRKQIYTILLWLFILIYIFYFGLISIMKFYSFGYYDFDLAVHDLSIWNILHGSIFNSILGISFLGNHVHIILFLIIPIYAVFSHPLTLLFLQTIALGLAALPLFKLSEHILDKNWALIISIIYLFYPALGYTNLYEFHPTVFATPLLMLTFYYYEQKSFLKFIIFAVLSMLCQENIPLAVIMFGALAIFNRRPKKWIITPILTGGLYFLIALLAMSYFNKNTVQFITIYRHLGNTPLKIIINILNHPSLLLKTLIRTQVFIYILQVFLPLVFIPLLSPLRLIPALPFFLQHMLSNRLSDLTIFYHYTAEIIPFIFISFIYAIKSLLNRRWVRHLIFLKISLLSMVILSNIYLGPHFAILTRLVREYKRSYLNEYKYKCINKIPPWASVVATFEFLPHLSHRRNLYSFHHIYTGFHTLSNKRYDLPNNIEYALIDFNDFLTFRGFYDYNNYKNLQMFLFEGNWQAEDFMETIVLFKKDIIPRYKLCQIIQDPDKEIENKSIINIEDEIKLIGYNLSNTEKKDILDITFYWRCIKPTEKDINIILDILDTDDNLIMRKLYPICYRIFPTNSWHRGENFKEKCRIKIPSNYFKSQYKLKMVFFDYRNGLLCKINGPVDNFGRANLLDIK